MSPDRSVGAKRVDRGPDMLDDNQMALAEDAADLLVGLAARLPEQLFVLALGQARRSKPVSRAPE